MSDNPLWPAALALLFLALGAWGALRVRRWWMRRVLLRRMRHARRGEALAGPWLERRGYRIVETQATRTAALLVDGAEVPFAVRADYLVEKAGVRAIVEVKTGAVADPGARATRRQILEYAWVFDVREVLLFDADAGTLRRVSVPGGTPRVASSWTWRRIVLLALALFIAGIATGVAIARLLAR